MKDFFIGIIIITGFLLYLSIDFSPPKPEDFKYGVSFSRFHADELKLDWKKTYLAILNDLKVKNFRFSAHWPLTEPEEGKYNFEELDFQMKEAQKAGASVILAVGRRLPGWPECHEPEWAKQLPQDQKQDKILKYIQAVVSRYKNYDNITYWQVENEPYLAFFSKSACGELDEEFLQKEINLVKSIDGTRQILVTDSGEFGTWFQAYKRADVFGSSMYLYIWNHTIGPFRYPIIPAFFKIKRNFVNIFLEEKPAIIIELSAEPWLIQPIVDTSVEIQLERMGLDKFNEMIDFSSETGFDTFYLWGAEWWYWLMEEHNRPEHWLRAQELFE